MIIAVYAALFFLVEGPWIRVWSVVGFAMFIRALTLFAMVPLSGIPLSQYLPMQIVTIVSGFVVFGVLIGVLYLVGNHFPSARPIVRILLIVGMVIVATQSTFPLGDLSDSRRENR